MNTPHIAQKSSCPVPVQEGQTYSWCACGLSKSQPFCDGSHSGTGFSPLVFTASETKTAYLCGCKHSKNAPFCDGAHKTL